MANPRNAFVVQEQSAAPPEQVFAVVADGAAWSRWAGPFVPRSRWEQQGDPAPGGVGAIRRLGLGPLASREQIVEFDPPHRLGYVLLARRPVGGYQATVQLTALPDGGTDIRWSGQFRSAPPGTAWLARRVLRAIVAGLARRLANVSGR